MKKKIVIVVVILFSILFAYRVTMFVIRKSSSNKEAIQKRGIPVNAMKVKKDDLVKKLKITGEIVGIEVVNVYSQVPGKVHSILIREGQRVGRGAILFRINRDIVGMEYNLAGVESPISGFVGKVMVDRGMTIAPTTPLAEIANMSAVEAVVRLIEEDINRVKIGMNADVQVSAYPDKFFRGTVYKKNAVLDSVSRTQEARIRLGNPGFQLKHGMFADVHIVIGKIKNALVIPSDAVIDNIDGTKTVFLVMNNTAVSRRIETGITVDNYIEIKSGLSEGDIIVSLGQENVTDGSPLIVYMEGEEKKPDDIEVKGHTEKKK